MNNNTRTVYVWSFLHTSDNCEYRTVYPPLLAEDEQELWELSKTRMGSYHYYDTFDAWKNNTKPVKTTSSVEVDYPKFVSSVNKPVSTNKLNDLIDKHLNIIVSVMLAIIVVAVIFKSKG